MRFGRITQGKEGEFEWIQRDGTGRRVTFCMGEDGLALFDQLPVLEVMRRIGFSDEWIKMRLEEGCSFRLYTWEEEIDQCVTLATWEKIPILARRIYGDVIAQKIEACIDEIRSTSFEELERRAQDSFLGKGARYIDVKETAAVGGVSEDPRYMDENRLADPANEGAEKVRGFLYNLFGLNRLFEGDGYSKDFHGNKSTCEYFVLNRRWEDIPSASFTTLSVSVSDLDLSRHA